MSDNLAITVLAILGALVSTALAALSLDEYLKDRPRLKVTLQPNMKATPSEYGSRRPTTITHVSLMLQREQGYLLCADPRTATYPVELTENKPHLLVFDEDELTRAHKLTPSQYVVCVDDAAGRRKWSHDPFARLWKLRRFN